MGKQAYKSHRIKFFENLKMQNVSCEAKFRCRVGVGRYNIRSVQ